MVDANAPKTLLDRLRESQRNDRKARVSAESVTNLLQADEEDLLSPEDWSLLLNDSDGKSLKKGDVIVKEGDIAAKIYQIGRGSCAVFKGSQKIATMNPGEVFGEISFLEGGQATATVTAAEDETDVYVIEAVRLKVLFLRKPALAGRFMQYLATVLSGRLKQREIALTLEK